MTVSLSFRRASTARVLFRICIVLYSVEKTSSSSYHPRVVAHLFPVSDALLDARADAARSPCARKPAARFASHASALAAAAAALSSSCRSISAAVAPSACATLRRASANNAVTLSSVGTRACDASRSASAPRRSPAAVLASARLLRASILSGSIASAAVASASAAATFPRLRCAADLLVSVVASSGDASSARVYASMAAA